MKLYKNKEWMEEKYLIQKLNTIEMAKLIGCGSTTITRWLKIFNIPIRSISEARTLFFNERYIEKHGVEKPPYEDKGWLEQQYLEHKLNMKEIAEIAKCTMPLIKRRLDEFGIERRSLSERTKLVWDKQFEDLSGRKFGKLTILEHMDVDKNHQRLWKCECDCGNITIKKGSEIKSGRTKSCGCMKYPSRMPAGEASFNKLLYVYKRNAENRGHKFELSRKEFRKLIQEPCHYCNMAPSQSHYSGGNGAFIYTGLDRLDNEKGYISSNVVPCCKQCNYAKMENSPQEFADWITRVYNHWIIHRKEIDL